MEVTIDDLLTYRDAVLSMEAQARNLLKDYARRFPFTSNSSIPEYRRYKRQCEAGISLERAAHCIEILRQAQQRLHELDSRVDVSVTIRRTVALKAPPIFVGSASYPTGHEAAVALGEAALNAWDGSGAVRVMDTWTRAGDASSDSWGTTGGPWGNSNAGAHALDALKHLARRLSRLRRHAPPDLWGRIEQEFWAAANDLPPDEGFYRWLAQHPEYNAAGSNPGAVGPQGERPSCTPDEANAAAMKLAEQDAGFVRKGIRSWAAEIEAATGKKCTTKIVGETRLWEETMEETGRGRDKGKRRSRPQAVRLIESAVGVGEPDAVLKRLTKQERDEELKRAEKEQAEDFEPSPLDEDPVDEPRRVRYRKRV